ncbi:MAG: hypothetical protein OXF44_13065 [Anaerolineaceae bacterium]|nr:hypothetical protein [Anaerolineaceae bacterium]
MGKLSRREMLQASAAGVAGVAATALPGGVSLASAPSQDDVTMRYQVFWPADYDQVLAAYTEANPHVTLEIISVTGTDHQEVATKILASLAAGTPIDIGFACTEATQLYAGEGLAAPLKSLLMDQADDFKEYFADISPVLSETMFWEGDYYQLMVDWNAANMFFNINLLNAAGLEMPEETWTREDFVAYAQAMTGLGEAGDSFGFAWPNRLWGGWMPWIFVNESNILSEERAPGGEWFWDTFYADEPKAEGRGGGYRWPEPQANNPAVVEALEFVVSLTAEGSAPTAELGFSQNMAGFFTNDKIGMFPAGGFFTGHLLESGMEMGEFDVQYWPAWASQRHQLGVCGPWLLNEGPNLDQAWDFVKFSTQREVMETLAFFRDTTRTTPVRRSMNNAERYADTGPANWHVFYGTADERPDTGPIPAPVFSVELSNIFTRYTSLAVSLEQSPQEAMDNMQAELEDLYARHA